MRDSDDFHAVVFIECGWSVSIFGKSSSSAIVDYRTYIVTPPVTTGAVPFKIF